MSQLGNNYDNLANACLNNTAESSSERLMILIEPELSELSAIQ